MTNWERLLKLKEQLNIKVEGLENYPQNNPCVIIANHNCLMDIFYLPAALETPTISLISSRLIYKNNIKRKKMINDHLYPLPIEAHGGHTYVNLCLNKAIKMITQGYSVSIFPEGAYLNPSNIIYQGRTGAARILFYSRANGIKVSLIPIAIEIQSEKLELDNYLPSNDTVTIKILEAIPFETEYQEYQNSSNHQIKNKILHQITNQGMMSIASSLNKNFNPNYIELYPKGNVIFQNGDTIDLEKAQNPYFIQRYQQELDIQEKKLIRDLSKN